MVATPMRHQWKTLEVPRPMFRWQGDPLVEVVGVVWMTEVG